MTVTLCVLGLTCLVMCFSTTAPTGFYQLIKFTFPKDGMLVRMTQKVNNLETVFDTKEGSAGLPSRGWHRFHPVESYRSSAR